MYCSVGKKQIINGFLNILLFFLFTYTVQAQVVVSGATGGNGNYTSLRLAFNAINATSQTGSTITVTVTADINEGTNTASLNEGSWTSLKIVPSGNRVITGSSSSVVLRLNGADNVTIDGLASNGNSLTIDNTYGGNGWSLSTIRLLNDASYNQIKNCVIKASGTNIFSGGVVLSSGLTEGNNYNTITQCSFIPSSGTVPACMVASDGSTGMNNSYNTVSNNTFQDFFSATANSAAINISNDNTNWTIAGNKFFQTTEKVASGLTAVIYHRFISISNTGTGYVISGNTLGFSDAQGNGVSTFSGSSKLSVRAIDITLNTSGSTATIENNTIGGIFNETDMDGSISPFVGIYCYGINFNILGNNIGSQSITNSIKITSYNDTLYTNSVGVEAMYTTAIYPVYVYASGACTISSNTVGGITCASTLDIPFTVSALHAGNTASYTLTNNVIGGTVSNSITVGVNGVSDTQPNYFFGIYNYSSGSSHIIEGNTIRNATLYNGNGSSSTSGARGIRLSLGTVISVKSNIIENISVKGTASIIGIQSSAPTQSVTINNNILRGNTTQLGAFTGIQNSGDATGFVEISANQLGTSSSALVSVTSAATGVVTSISNGSTQVVDVVKINGNTFGNVDFVSGATSSQYCIYNTVVANTLDISNNVFANIVSNSGTRSLVLIRNDVSMPAGAVWQINNNSISGSLVRNNSGTFYAYYAGNSTSDASALFSFTNNNFNNVTLNGSTGGYGIYLSDQGTAKRIITGNSFSNWTTGTGTLCVIQVGGLGTGSTVSQNTISNISNQYVLTGISLFPIASGTTNVLNNVITGLSSSGGSVSAITTYSNANTVNISNNSIANLSCSAASSQVNGCWVAGGNNTINVNNNTFNNFTQSNVTGPIINGVNISAGNIANFYNNKITNFSLSGASTSGSVNGVNLVGGTLVTVYNNYIGAFFASTSNATLIINGVRSNATTTSTHNVYNNTIYFDGTSSGTNFGSCGIYHRAYTTAAYSYLTLKNNIIVNKSTAKGSGKICAIYRTSSSLQNYNTESNNNLFYAGTPGTANVVLNQVSAYYQTLASAKAVLTPAEKYSLTENVSFISTDPTSGQYLHLPDNSVTLAEGNAQVISGITTDYDGQSRDSVYPDLGADEFNGQKANVTAVDKVEFCTGSAGQVVTITGTNLGLVTRVTFVNSSSQRVDATITSNNGTTITVTTPASFVSGTMQVMYGGGVYSGAYIVYDSVAATINGGGTVCANSAATLTAVGVQGTIVRWESSANAGFSSGVTAIQNTTATLVVSDISTTKYYRVVIQNGVCGTVYSSVAGLGSLSSVWNGSTWSAGVPTASVAAVINANLTITSNLEACSLTVDNNATVVIEAGANVILNGALNVVSGSFTLSDTANLIQLTNVTNSGNISVLKKSSELFRLDYSMWSSPVTGTQTLQDFSPETNTSRFYTYNPLTAAFATTQPTNTFGAAKGYLIRMPNSWVAYNASNPVPAAWTGTFTGTPNNGTYAVALTTGGTASTSFNLIGNPYPSAISISNFLTQNANSIYGTIWLWRKRNDAGNPVSYSVCTAAGCTLNNGFTGYFDDSTISTGQGFMVRAKQTGSSVIFNNSVRTSSNVSQFFRQAEKNRYWLSLTNESGLAYGQMLVAYIPEGTIGYDEGYDGIYNNENATFLGALVNSFELAVEARPLFTTTDTLPLYFKTDQSGTYTIALPRTEGVFAGTQEIYIKDNLYGTIHNISSGGYTFTTEQGTFDNRFEIIYQENALSTSDTQKKENSVVVYSQNSTINVVAQNSAVKTIEVYDVSGRLVYKDDNINALTYTSKVLSVEHQVYIVKVTDENNKQKSFRLIL